MGNPSLILFPLQDIRNPFTGMAIAIRIAGIGHLLVLFIILQKHLESAVDHFFGSTDELQCPGINSFRSLGGIPPDENRNTIGRTLFLDST